MDETSFRSPLTLTGRHVELVPLSREHAPELLYAFRDPEVTRLLRNRVGSTVEEVEAGLGAILEQQAAGLTIPFATRLTSSHRVVGMTRFGSFDRRSGVVEIGGTVLDSTYWRTPVNTEAKWLMLSHAFEVERAHRVQFQTDRRNERSQRAIERLGAVREATLREDVLLPDGSFRSSVYFSLLEFEWPGAAERLRRALERPWVPPAAAGSGPKVLARRDGPGPSVPAASGSLGPPGSARLSFSQPLELRGRWVHLVPLSRSFLPELVEAGADPEVWRFMRIRHGDSPEGMAALVDELLTDRDRGEVLPFVVRAGDPERTVGGIRFLDIRRNDRGVEIGTWLSRSVWRTPVNTEAKYLLLRHAFETEHVHRVQLKADQRNQRSQEAIRRLGAVPEGPMREHYRFDWGGYRTSEFFSVLEPEWPAVRARLEEQLRRPFEGPLRPLARPTPPA